MDTFDVYLLLDRMKNDVKFAKNELEKLDY